MKKIRNNLIVMALILITGYGILAFIGWLMTLSIPVPVLIIGFCYLLYKVSKEV